jgi:hypothetical protein
MAPPSRLLLPTQWQIWSRLGGVGFGLDGAPRRPPPMSDLAPTYRHAHRTTSPGASVSPSGVTVFALDPQQLTLEEQPNLSLEDAWAVIAAAAPSPPLLLHRQPGEQAVRCSRPQSLLHAHAAATVLDGGCPVQRSHNLAQADRLHAAAVCSPPCSPPQHLPQDGSPVEREFQRRARAMLGSHHCNAVRMFTAPNAGDGFRHEALLMLGLAADEMTTRRQVGHCTPRAPVSSQPRASQQRRRAQTRPLVLRGLIPNLRDLATTVTTSPQTPPWRPQAKLCIPGAPRGGRVQQHCAAAGHPAHRGCPFSRGAFEGGACVKDMVGTTARGTHGSGCLQAAYPQTRRLHPLHHRRPTRTQPFP